MGRNKGREYVHPNPGGDLNMGPPEWQPSGLTKTQLHLCEIIK